jgi:hypothetical protein
MDMTVETNDAVMRGLDLRIHHFAKKDGSPGQARR